MGIYGILGGIMLVDFDLRDIDDIDALTKMLKLTFSNEDWHPMLKIADKLYEEAWVIYFYLKEQSEEGKSYRGTYERPLLYYFGFSQLTKGISLQKLGDFQGARECILKYQDLSWMDRTSDTDYKIIEDFRMFAIGNTYTLDLLEGKEEVLPEYIEHIKRSKTDPLELLAGVITIFEAALRNNFVIDWVLEQFADSINEIRRISYANPADNIYIRYFTEYLYLFSLYKFKQYEYSAAIQITLEALAVSGNLKDSTAFKKVVVLFETYREHASREQKQNYKSQLKTILEGVLTDEKSISFSSLHGCLY